MSIRHAMLAALNNESMIMDGLVDATGEERRRLTDNMTSCIKEELVNRTKDVVTGMPFYTISEKGKQRLAEGQKSYGGKRPTEKKPVAKAIAKAMQEEEAMPPADAGLLAKANRMLSERLEAIRRALDVDSFDDMVPAIKLLHSIEIDRDNIQASLDKFSPIKQPPAPLFWMAYSKDITPSVISDTEIECRKQAELLALSDGYSFVCAVMAECESVVKWKEAA